MALYTGAVLHRIALALLIVAGLLVQNLAWASTAPVFAAHQEQHSMPCHDDGQPPMPCCDDPAQCHMICCAAMSMAASASVIALFADVAIPVSSPAPPRAAHRLTLLRPPISASA